MNHTDFVKLPRLGRAPVTDAVAAWRPLTAVRALLHRLADRAIDHWSLIPRDAVLDVRLFPWTAALRAEWQAVRDEMLTCRGAGAAPWSHGEWIGIDTVRTPVSAAALAKVPGVGMAGFSFLPPGAYVAGRRGATKAFVTCQLGLVVPGDGDVRMRVGDRVVRWAEGETLMVDDTAPHELWNDSAGTRVVLLVRVRRPLRQPGRWLVDRVLNLLAR